MLIITVHPYLQHLNHDSVNNNNLTTFTGSPII